MSQDSAELAEGLRVDFKLDYMFSREWHRAHHMILLCKHSLGK